MFYIPFFFFAKPVGSASLHMALYKNQATDIFSAFSRCH